MTENKVKAIDSLQFDSIKPTELSFTELYTWVIWQFPRKQKSGLCGAVHPPIPEFGWLPAIIHPKKQQLTVHCPCARNVCHPRSCRRLFGRQKQKKSGD